MSFYRTGHIIVCIVAVIFSLAGCDPVVRHKALTTVFDGVPSLPPTEELCREYEEKLKARLAATATATAEKAATERSAHNPYVEKRCNDCHESTGQVSSGLIKPKNELCFICHSSLMQNDWSHGPAAVGDCLICHLPHDSSNPSLLVMPLAEICSKCHKERRLAESMHNRFTAKGMLCTDCHDPHSGTSGFFLK